MKFTTDMLETKLYVKDATSLFEDVVESHNRIQTDTREFSILNYEKMLNDMIEFIKGYNDYKRGSTGKYKGQVVGSMASFYNKMFTDEKTYRKKIHLRDMNDLIETFLKKTKELNDLLDSMVHDAELDVEVKNVIEVTNNQYRKIAKVNRDDMRIYLWLCYKDTFRRDTFSIPLELRLAFKDKRTPVMHEVPKK